MEKILNRISQRRTYRNTNNTEFKRIYSIIIREKKRQSKT